MKIQELRILSNDLAGSKHFYTKVLGVSAVKESHDLLTLQIGESLLTFVYAAEASPYHIAFNIPAKSIHDCLAYYSPHLDFMPTAGANSPIVDFENWEAKALYFFDNNGNIMEFIARDAMPSLEGDTFTSNSLLSISEIGMVGEPLEDIARMEMEYDIRPFHRQAPRAHFAAAGDDEGLLIFVKEGRAWYPTQIAAKSQYTYIFVKNEGIELNILGK